MILENKGGRILMLSKKYLDKKTLKNSDDSLHRKLTFKSQILALYDELNTMISSEYVDF